MKKVLIFSTFLLIALFAKVSGQTTTSACAKDNYPNLHNFRGYVIYHGDTTFTDHPGIPASNITYTGTGMMYKVTKPVTGNECFEETVDLEDNMFEDLRTVIQIGLDNPKALDECTVVLYQDRDNCWRVMTLVGPHELLDKYKYEVKKD